MKKLIAVILSLAMLLSFAACNNAPAESSEPEASTSEPVESGDPAEEKTYVVGICQIVQHVALDAATQGFSDALTEKLGDKVTINVQNASNDVPTCGTICNQFVADGVDLIMANATPALQSAAAATNTIPIVGTSVTDFATTLNISDWTGATGTNITGTSDIAPLTEQANMINEIFPDSKTVGILYCSGEPNSAYQADIVEEALTALGKTCKRYTFADSNEVANVTQSACENDVIYIPTDNTAANCTEVIKNVVVAAGVPVVAGEEGICSGCGVATLSINYYDIGYAAGEMAYEILVNGANPGEMEIGFAKAVTKKYNAEICETLGITVPEDYVAIG